MKYLAFCCIAKDEDVYLKEWLTYHANLGVEHFYIYDNASKRPIQELLEGFANPEKVTVINAANRAMQLPAYNHCLGAFGYLYKWMGFFDLDEFLCPFEYNDLRLFLAEFEQYAGLGVHWRMFSSNSQKQRPAGLVIENYTQQFIAEDFHVKCFIQPAKCVGVKNSHSFTYLPNEYSVNDVHQPIPLGSPYSIPSYEQIQINHYYFKSEEDFSAKIERGRNEIVHQNSNHFQHVFNSQLSEPCEPHTAISRFIPQVITNLATNTLVFPDCNSVSLNCTIDITRPLHELLQEVSTAISNKQWNTAELLLCYCSINNPDTIDITLLRTSAARRQQHFKKAHYYLTLCLKQEAHSGALLELFHLHLDQNQFAAAKKAHTLLAIFLRRRRLLTPQWEEMLATLNTLLEQKSKLATLRH